MILQVGRRNTKELREGTNKISWAGWSSRWVATTTQFIYHRADKYESEEVKWKRRGSVKHERVTEGTNKISWAGWSGRWVATGRAPNGQIHLSHPSPPSPPFSIVPSFSFNINRDLNKQTNNQAKIVWKSIFYLKYTLVNPAWQWNWLRYK